MCDSTISELHNKENIEVFFPGEYMQMTCDGTYPQNGWSKVALRLRQQPIFDGREKITIPIVKVRHVTHSEQARGIRSANYSFVPKPKLGKKYDSTDEGTYKKVLENTFQKIGHDERVLEGNISWWGLDAYSWYKSEDERGQEFGSVASSLYSNRIFVSPFMSDPRESRYGSCGFVVNFRDLVTSYKESRTDIVNTEDRAVFLRVGGTLRYRFEICYIVIVCTKYDKELECYPSLYTCPEIFDHKGLLHPSGQIEEKFFASSETIDFRIRHVIKCVPDRQYSSYETPAFAFYYPQTSTTSALKCPPGKVEEVKLDHKCNRLCHTKNLI